MAAGEGGGKCIGVLRKLESRIRIERAQAAEEGKESAEAYSADVSPGEGSKRRRGSFRVGQWV